MTALRKFLWFFSAILFRNFCLYNAELKSVILIFISKANWQWFKFFPFSWSAIWDGFIQCHLPFKQSSFSIQFAGICGKQNFAETRGFVRLTNSWFVSFAPKIHHNLYSMTHQRWMYAVRFPGPGFLRAPKNRNTIHTKIYLRIIFYHIKPWLSEKKVSLDACTKYIFVGSTTEYPASSCKKTLHQCFTKFISSIKVA